MKRKATSRDRATIRVLDNRRCSISGLDKRSIRLLDEALSIDVPGAHFQRAVKKGFWDGKRHLFSKKKMTFPKGLLQRVEDFMYDLGWRVKVIDKRLKVLEDADLSLVNRKMLKGDPERGEPKRIKLRSYQMKAIRKGLKRQAGIFWLATNAGKTEVACAIMKVLGAYRALFLVHKKALLEQARERIARRFGTIEEHIGIIGDGQFDPKHITVATIQTLSRRMHPKKQRILQSYYKTIGQLHVDEGHHTKATTWYKLINRIDAQYRFIYSGTPFAGDNGLMVEAAVGPVIHRVSNAKLIRLGVSAVPTVEMVSCEGPELDADLSWDDVYKKGIVENEDRNYLIAKRARKQARKENPTMILVNHLFHGDLIGQQLDALGVEYLFAHGKMPRHAQRRLTQQFEAGYAPILIASPIFDEGVDMPAIRSLIIADGGKSVRAVLQKVGRGLRKKKQGKNTLNVIDFADMSHRWLAKHSQDRIAIYEGEGFEMKS